MLDFQGLYEGGEVLVSEAIYDSLNEIKDNISGLKLDVDEIDTDTITSGSKAYDIMQLNVLNAINELSDMATTQAYDQLSNNPNVHVEDIELSSVLSNATVDLERIYSQYVKTAIDNSYKALGNTIETAKSKYRDRRRILEYIADAYFLNVRYQVALENYVTRLERDIEESEGEEIRPLYGKEDIDELAGIYTENAERNRVDSIAILVSTSTVGASAESVISGLAGIGAIASAVRKYWVHMNDGAVRNSHLQIPQINPDGVPLDGTFLTPLGPLRYPGDPIGVPANVINCRCHLRYKIGGYDAL